MNKCRICGCTDTDCRQCIEKTGEPCYWVKDDLCSACAGAPLLSGLTEYDAVIPSSFPPFLKELMAALYKPKKAKIFFYNKAPEN